MFIKALGSKNSQKDVNCHADFIITNTSTRVAIVQKPLASPFFPDQPISLPTKLLQLGWLLQQVTCGACALGV